LNETKAREEICRVGASLFARGLVSGSAGNISVRLDEHQGGGYLITPTDACLGFLDPAQLSRVDDDGQAVSGPAASKTITLHRSIYQASRRHDNKVSCLIHTHSSHCVALSLSLSSLHETTEHGQSPSQALRPVTSAMELLPPITPYFVMKVGHVPHLSYYRPGSPEMAIASVETIQAYAARGVVLRALMMARLGPNVWHHSPSAAMATLEELEETAKIWMLSAPKPKALSERDLQELRHNFNAIW
jgi:3-dehydro-4-phosphotetronate decarboxylase